MPRPSKIEHKKANNQKDPGTTICMDQTKCLQRLNRNKKEM